MKKILSIILVATILAGALSACLPFPLPGVGGTEAETTAGEPEEGTTVEPEETTDGTTVPEEETTLPEETTEPSEDTTEEPTTSEQPQDTTAEPESTTAEPPETTEPAELEENIFVPEVPITLDIVSNGADLVRIIYQSDSEECRAAATLLNQKIEEATGVGLLMFADNQVRPNSNKAEILVGYTNRPESESMRKFVGYNDYGVYLQNNKLIVGGWKDGCTAKAAEKFVELYCGSTARDLSVSSSNNYASAMYYQNNAILGRSTAARKILGRCYGEYKIVIPANAELIEERFALRLQNYILQRTGAVLEIVKDSKTRSDFEIRIGKTSRTAAEVGKNKYLITANGSSIEMLSDSYYGYDYLFEAFKSNMIAKLNKAEVGCGDIINQSYEAELIEDGSESYLSKSGDIRIIYHNIGGFDVFPTTPNRSCMPWLRNPMTVEYYKNFGMDVLCLEEITPTMRAEGVPQIGELLSEYGYAEVAPNMTHTFGGHTNLKTTTPIYYNTETLTLVAGGSKNYQEELSNGLVSGLDGKALIFQWDKFMSWAVFEHKETHKKFAVINVHFDSFDEDTNGDGRADRMVGEEKSKILVDFIIRCANSIVADYSCPVMIGGDMNVSISAVSYQMYNDAGYTHVREISEVADETRGHFGHYPVYNSTMYGEFFELSRDVSFNNSDYRNSVDHVYVDQNGRGRIDFKLFDVLADPSNGSFGDHCGMLIDFNIK